MEDQRMKRTFAAACTALTAGTMAALMAVNTPAAQITEDKARSIALENAGQKEEDVTFAKATTDMEDGQLVYEIKFVTADYQKYDYDILAADGMILTIEYDAQPAKATHNSRKTTISQDRAKEISLAHAGQKEENVTFTKTEADRDDGRLEYEFEFVDGEKKEYQYEINGSTGAIIGWKYDAKNYLASTSGSTQKAAISNVEAAKAAALKQAGLKSGDVTWGQVKTDYDDGRLIYEGEFFHGTLEYEFEIDGVSGMIIGWDVDSIYD
jgi:uncharacterized membrane protein YkoI